MDGTARTRRPSDVYAAPAEFLPPHDPATPNPRRRADNYADPAALSVLVRQQRREGKVSDELARLLLLIAGGVWDRYRFTEDRDEFCSACYLHLTAGAPLRAADPHRNLFSFFSECVRRYGAKLRNRTAAERRKFTAYAQDLHHAGRVEDVAGESVEG
jgi:hypothetical protein